MKSRSASKRERKEKRNKMILSLVMAAIMISSIAGFVVVIGGSNQLENRFTVEAQTGDFLFEPRTDNVGNPFYVVSSDTAQFTGFSSPYQIPLENVSQEALSMMRTSQAFYLAFDPEDPGITNIEYLRFDLPKNQPKMLQSAVTQESPLYAVPKVSCSNATAAVPVMMLSTANSTTITQEGYCINITFVPYQILRIRDIMVYSLQGIELT